MSHGTDERERIILERARLAIERSRALRQQAGRPPSTSASPMPTSHGLSAEQSPQGTMPTSGERPAGQGSGGRMPRSRKRFAIQLSHGEGQEVPVPLLQQAGRPPSTSASPMPTSRGPSAEQSPRGTMPTLGKRPAGQGSGGRMPRSRKRFAIQLSHGEGQEVPVPLRASEYHLSHEYSDVMFDYIDDRGADSHEDQSNASPIVQLLSKCLLDLRKHMGYSDDVIMNHATSILRDHFNELDAREQAEAARSSGHGPQGEYVWSAMGRRARDRIILHTALLAARRHRFRRWIRDCVARSFNTEEQMQEALDTLISQNRYTDRSRWIMSEELLQFIADGEEDTSLTPDIFLSVLLYTRSGRQIKEIGKIFPDKRRKSKGVLGHDEVFDAMERVIFAHDPSHIEFIYDIQGAVARGDMHTIMQGIERGLFWRSVLWDYGGSMASERLMTDMSTFKRTFGPFSCRIAAAIAVMYSHLKQDTFYAAGNGMGGTIGAFGGEHTRYVEAFRDIYNIVVILRGDDITSNLIDATDSALNEFEQYVSMRSKTGGAATTGENDTPITSRFRTEHVADPKTSIVLLGGEGGTQSLLDALKATLSEVRSASLEAIRYGRDLGKMRGLHGRTKQVNDVTESFIYAICSDYIQRASVAGDWLRGQGVQISGGAAHDLFKKVRPDLGESFSRLSNATRRTVALVSLALCGSAIYDIIVARAVCQTSLATIVDDHYYDAVMGRFKHEQDANWPPENEKDEHEEVIKLATRGLDALHQATNAVQLSSLYVAIRANLQRMVYGTGGDTPLSQLWDAWNAYMIQYAAGNLASTAQYGHLRYGPWAESGSSAAAAALAAICRRWCNFESPYHQLSPAYSADILRRTPPPRGESRIAAREHITALIGMQAGTGRAPYHYFDDEAAQRAEEVKLAADMARRHLTCAANAIFGLGAENIEQVTCGAFVRAAVDAYQDAIATDPIAADDDDDGDRVELRPNVYAIFETAIRDYATYVHGHDVIVKRDDTADGVRINHEWSFMWKHNTTYDRNLFGYPDPLGSLRDRLMSHLLAGRDRRISEAEETNKNRGWLGHTTQFVYKLIGGRGSSRDLGPRLFVPQFKTIRPGFVTGNSAPIPWLWSALSDAVENSDESALRNIQIYRARRSVHGLTKLSNALASERIIGDSLTNSLPDWLMHSVYAFDQQLFADALGAVMMGGSDIHPTLERYYNVMHGIVAPADRSTLTNRVFTLIKHTAESSQVGFKNLGNVMSYRFERVVSDWMNTHRMQTEVNQLSQLDDGRGPEHTHLLLNMCHSPYNFTLSATFTGVADAKGNIHPPLIAPSVAQADVRLELIRSRADALSGGAGLGRASDDRIQETPDSAEEGTEDDDDDDGGEVEEMRAWFDDVF